MKQHEVDAIAVFLADPEAKKALEVVVRAARRKKRGKEPLMLFGDAGDGDAALEAAKQFLANVKAVDCTPRELTAHLACKLARIIGRAVTATSKTHTVTVQPWQSGKEWSNVTKELPDPSLAAHNVIWRRHFNKLLTLDTRIVAYYVQWLEAVADDTPFMTQDQRDFLIRRFGVATGWSPGTWHEEEYEGQDPNQMAAFIVRRALLLLSEKNPLNGTRPGENIPAMVAKWRELAAKRNAARKPGAQTTFLN